MRRPVSIYCDWALHDELGDNVPLTEEMTMGALDTLARWKQEHGVGFDYYLIDAFWYERPGDYTRFNPQTWPGGFEPARKRMAELGMTPGLWLDVSGGQVTGHEPWAESLDARNRYHCCLFDGPYGQGLLEAMLHAAEAWGVRLFKFDFANFHAVTARHARLDAGEVYARNVRAFKEILRSVRRAHPDALMLAYNGFAHLPDYLAGTTGPVVPGIDPAWLEVVDYLYSGDPRPADSPCASLRRAVDLYQDHMVAKFNYSGIPMERIDDHGCMVGTTNTIYGLGKTGWRRTWVQSLGRGSRKAHFYGDLHLLDDGDVEFLKAARNIFFDLFERDAPTQLLGGVPCQAPWHGFLTGGTDDGLLVLANGTAEAQDVPLSLDGLQGARVLFHDEGFQPGCTARDERLSVRLAPEQMALLGLGARAEERFELGPNVGGDPVSPEAQRLALEFASAEGTATCETPAAAITGAADEAGCDGLRISFRLRDAGRACRRTFERDRAVSDALNIKLEADGRAVEPRKVVPDVPVWSGCSWLTALYAVDDLRGAAQLSLTLRCPKPEPEIIPEAWLQGL